MIADSSCKTLKLEAAHGGYGVFGIPSFLPKLPIRPGAVVISFQILLMAKQV